MSSQQLVGVISGVNEFGHCDPDYCEVDENGKRTAHHKHTYIMTFGFLDDCVRADGILEPEKCFQAR